MNSLTVCITNFKRPTFLARAIKSCVTAGIQRVAVFSMEPDAQVLEVIRRAKTLPIHFSFDSLPVDLGCQETWLQAVYRANTERVIVLHDDDMLAPEFGAAYRDIIGPVLDSGKAGFASWRGHIINERNQVAATEYFKSPTGIFQSTEIERVVMTPGRLSLSPVVSVFNRTILLNALKECVSALVGDESHLHPGMTLGTEILAYLRHCSHFKTWLYVDQVLSFYGSHGGSGTIKAQQSGGLTKLTVGYDFARNYFVSHRDKDFSEPRLLFVFSEYRKNGIDEQRRCDNASTTWQFHFNQGTLLSFPVLNADLPRTSAHLGDSRPVPYVKDLIDYGIQFAMADDIVVIANRDICLTTVAPERIEEGVKRGKGFTAAIRRNWSQMPAGRLRRTVLNCKPDGGFDLFAMTPAWWAAHRDKMPDMLLGREAWDTVLRNIAEDLAGKDAYVDDATYHEYHHSFWLREKMTNPGQIHNRKLAREFFTKRNDYEKAKLLA